MSSVKEDANVFYKALRGLIRTAVADELDKRAPKRQPEPESEPELEHQLEEMLQPEPEPEPEPPVAAKEKTTRPRFPPNKGCNRKKVDGKECVGGTEADKLKDHEGFKLCGSCKNSVTRALRAKAKKSKKETDE
jgi:hypothetical protein